MTNMNKTAIQSILVATVLVAGIFALMPVMKAYTDDDDDDGGRQSDHGLVSIPDGEKGFCGSTREPWTMHIAVGDGVDDVTLTFNDGDSLSLGDGPGSFTFAFGGVPGVDNVVMVSAVSGGAIVVSAEATANSIDPFDEDDDGKLKEKSPPPNETDNYCVVDPSEFDVEEDAGSGDNFGEENTLIGTDDP